MELNFSKMREAKSKLEEAERLSVKAGDLYNTAVDEFDDEVKSCEFYEHAVCHGEEDPECTHEDNEFKWCEAQTCPLL